MLIKYNETVYLGDSTLCALSNKHVNAFNSFFCLIHTYKSQAFYKERPLVFSLWLTLGHLEEVG